MSQVPKSVAWVEGQIVDPSAPQISLLDRAYLYGDSVFEVLRTYAGRPCELDAHCARLRSSAEALRFRGIPEHAELRHAAEVTLEEAACLGGDVYLRMVLSRGRGPIRYALDALEAPELSVIATLLTPIPEATYRIGQALHSQHLMRPADNALARHTKASNYLVHILGIDEARQQGADEVLVLGAAGEVLEGGTSNVFFVRGGRVFTPHAGLPILNGITRQRTVEVIRSSGLECVEGLFFIRELYEADELFITSSLREVMPITVLDGQPVGTGAPGPITQHLRTRYLAAVSGAEASRA